ncbi:hypothetical protein J6590_067363 [Homalodisca vitripennis]|nr:hypothetical protein J6590_067363 [Homalodisca vitripennis]
MRPSCLTESLLSSHPIVPNDDQGVQRWREHRSEVGGVKIRQAVPLLAAARRYKPVRRYGAEPAAAARRSTYYMPQTQELSPKSPRIGTVPEASGHGTPSLTSPSAITIHRKELGPKNDPTARFRSVNHTVVVSEPLAYPTVIARQEVVSDANKPHSMSSPFGFFH